MAIEAPLSRYKKNSLLIAIIALAGFGIWCVYDGYFNETFISENSDPETGEAKGTLVFNRKSPPFFFGGALLIGAYWFIIRNRKIVATDSELVVSKTLTIPYDAIQSIDKTHFSEKGYFDIMYQRSDGSEAKARLDDRKNDKLQVILDHLVDQIT